MASNDSHFIQRFKFDFEVEDQEKAKKTQDELSRIFQFKLKRILEEALDEFQVEGHLLRIKLLELDLGDISESYFESDLIDRFRSTLRKELAEIRGKAAYPSSYYHRNEELIPLWPAKLEMVTYFLEYGRLPVSASRFPQRVDEILKDLIKEIPQEVRSNLRTLFHKHAYVSQRLIEQFSEDVVEQVFRIFNDSYFVFIQREYRALAEQIRVEYGLNKNSIEKILLEASLVHLVKTENRPFSRQSYFRSVRRFAERRTNQDLERAFPESVGDNEGRRGELDRRYEPFLKLVRQAMSGELNSSRKAELTNAFEVLIRFHVEALQEIVQSGKDRKEAFEHLVEILPTESVQRYIQVVSPAKGKEILRVAVRAIAAHSRYLKGRASDTQFRNETYTALFLYVSNTPSRSQSSRTFSEFLKESLKDEAETPEELIETWTEVVEQGIDIPLTADDPVEPREERFEESGISEDGEEEEGPIEAPLETEDQPESLETPDSEEVPEEEIIVPDDEKIVGEEEGEEAEEREEERADDGPQDEPTLEEDKVEEDEAPEQPDEEPSEEDKIDETIGVEEGEDEIPDAGELPDQETEEETKEPDDLEEVEEVEQTDSDPEESEEAEDGPSEEDGEEERVEDAEVGDDEAGDQSVPDEDEDKDAIEGIPGDDEATEITAEDEADEEAAPLTEGTEKPPEGEEKVQETESEIGEEAEPEIPKGDSERTRTDLVLHILETGEIPWWSKNLIEPDPIRAFTSLLEEESKVFLSEFRQKVKEAPVSLRALIATRMLERFGPVAAQNILKQAVPDIFGLYVTVSLVIERYRNAKSPTILSQSLQEPNTFRWYPIVRFFLDHIEDPPGPAQLIRYVVRMVAASTGQAVSDVITGVREVVNEAVNQGEMRFLPFQTLLPRGDQEVQLESPEAEASVRFEEEIVEALLQARPDEGEVDEGLSSEDPDPALEEDEKDIPELPEDEDGQIVDPQGDRVDVEKQEKPVDKKGDAEIDVDDPIIDKVDSEEDEKSVLEGEDGIDGSDGSETEPDQEAGETGIDDPEYEDPGLDHEEDSAERTVDGEEESLIEPSDETEDTVPPGEDETVEEDKEEEDQFGDEAVTTEELGEEDEKEPLEDESSDEVTDEKIGDPDDALSDESIEEREDIEEAEIESDIEKSRLDSEQEGDSEEITSEETEEEDVGGDQLPEREIESGPNEETSGESVEEMEDQKGFEDSQVEVDPEKKEVPTDDDEVEDEVEGEESKAEEIDRTTEDPAITEYDEEIVEKEDEGEEKEESEDPEKDPKKEIPPIEDPVEDEPLPEPDQSKEEIEEEIRKILEEPEISREDVVLYYLQTGSLPPEVGTLSEPAVWAMIQEIVSEDPGKIEKALREQSGSIALGKRIANLPTPIFESIVRLLLPQSQEEQFVRFFRELRKLFADESSPLKPLDIGIHAFKYLAQTGETTRRLEEYILDLIKHIETETAIPRPQLVDWMIDASQQNPSLVSVTLEEILASIKGQMEPPLDVSTEEEPDYREVDNPELPVPEEEAQEEEPEIYVNNAGLILFSPMLSRAFKNLEYLDLQGRFKSEQLKERAIYFLAYLSHKDEEVTEDGLVLNKLMTGWELNTPVQAGITLDEKEKEIAEGMIDEMRSKWTGMDNTKNDTMRTSWYQRDGRLSTDKYSTWVLRVDQKAYDLLLGRLAYSVPYFDGSWTSTTIRVEWQ